jgi:hypothetical protein
MEKGLKGSEIESRSFSSDKALVDHVESVHHLAVKREGETDDEADARFREQFPGWKECPCVPCGSRQLIDAGHVSMGSLKLMGYKDVPVAIAKQVGEMFGKDMVVILCYDKKTCYTHTTTWGREAEDKEIAAKAGEITAKALGTDLTAKTTYQDFHDVPDHPVQFEDGALKLALFLIDLEGNPIIPTEGQTDALMRLEFIREVGSSGASGYFCLIEPDGPEELVKLLPAYKARIREVLSGSSV